MRQMQLFQLVPACDRLSEDDEKALVHYLRWTRGITDIPPSGSEMIHILNVQSKLELRLRRREKRRRERRRHGRA